MKFSVTEELSALLEKQRREHKITAQILSAAVGKSPSYISKLEKRSLGSILDADLIRVFCEIWKESDFFGVLLPRIVTEYLRLYGLESLSSQLWLINLDLIVRQIPVPETLVARLLAQMEKMGIDHRQYAHLINENRDSPTMTGLPKNEFVHYTMSDGKELLLIWLEMPPELILDVLEGRQKLLSFSQLNALVYTILREERFGPRDFTAEEAEHLLHDCQNVLEHFGILPTVPYAEMVISKNDTHNEMSINANLSSTNNETVGEITEILRSLVESDMLAGTQAISQILRNLHWDAGFMLKLMCLPYPELDPISYSAKADLLKEMRRLLERYEHLPASRKTFEIYE